MNSKLLFRVLIVGLGLLAGVQFWVLTGSIFVSVAVAAAAVAFLGWFSSGLDRKKKVTKRFVGEVTDPIIEDEFVHEVRQDNEVMERMSKKVREQPHEVASSIRSMLLKDARKDSDNS